VLLNVAAAKAFAYLDDFRKLSGHMERSSAMMLGSKMKIETDGADGRAVGSRVRMHGKVLGHAVEVLYWYDPMYPQQRFDKPGKSPFMDMQLVPKYAGEAAEAGSVAISPQVVQNLGVRTAEAKSGAIQTRFEAVGSIAYNERGKAAAEITLRHGPIPELGMDPMSTIFKAADRALLERVKKGDLVKFKAGLVDGRFGILSINAVKPKRKGHQ
jgi:Cu/Ag efflux protein CusF